MERVLVVESFSRSEGAAWAANLAQELTGHWPTDVVITHYHGDHANGVAGFRKDGGAPRIWTTPTTRKLLSEGRISAGRGDEAARAELIDGAVFGTYNEHFTWPIMETIVPYMCARHGHDINFVGCIIVRSNWEAQAEKQLMANRAAQMARDIGADGAIVTTNQRGQRFVETIGD